MSQTNDICPNCKKPRSPNHTLIGFNGDVPKLQCNRKPEDGPDPKVEGVNLLWDRMEAAEAKAAAIDTDLVKKTADHKAALSRIAVLERENNAQKNAIADFQEKLTKANSDKEAVTKAVLEIERSKGAELKKAQADLEKLDKDFSAKLGFKEQRLAETETEILKLRGKIDEITAGLVSAHARAEAETDVVTLDQMKKPAVARKAPPPPPAPAPAVAPLTGPPCMCCDAPTRATKVAKDKWVLKSGSYVEPLYTCKKLVAHANDLYAVLDAYRDQLVNAPDDPSELLTEFEDINPNP